MYIGRYFLKFSTATYWSYVKRAALYRTFISQSFVRGNNSNDPVAGRVSGVVVDEGGHTVCLSSVTRNVVVNGGWSLMRGVVNEGFYCRPIWRTGKISTVNKNKTENGSLLDENIKKWRVQTL